MLFPLFPASCSAKNRPGFHYGNRGGSFALFVLFQALTQSLAGVLDRSLSGCQNYRALGKNDNTFLSSHKSYSRNISCSIVTPYCKILSIASTNSVCLPAFRSSFSFFRYCSDRFRPFLWMRLSNFSAKLPDSARFACITNKFRATTDSHMQVMAASLMTEQDVVLFVSYSGATRDLIETLRTAKANGAKVILITHKGSDIHRILLPFFLCKKSCRTGKTGAATLFAGTCTGATGRTSGRNTLIYQRRQRSPSGTFQCRHRSEGGGSSAPAPYMARWQCVHRPVRSP